MCHRCFLGKTTTGARESTLSRGVMWFWTFSFGASTPWSIICTSIGIKNRLSVCVSLFLSLDLREAFTSNHHSFCWTQHRQEHEFCFVLTQHSLRINLVCGKPDPAGTWVRHRLRLWTRDYCFFSEAWNQLKCVFFALVWFNSWLLFNTRIIIWTSSF